MISTLIWWGSESGKEPTMFLTDTVVAGRRAFVKHLIDEVEVELNEIYEIDDEWIAEHPAPDLDDDEAVEQWCDDFKEQTTDAWLLQYQPKGEPVEGAGESYHDLRTYRPMPASQVQPGDQIEGSGTVRWIVGPMIPGGSPFLPLGGYLITFTADTQMGVPGELVLSVARPTDTDDADDADESEENL